MITDKSIFNDLVNYLVEKNSCLDCFPREFCGSFIDIETCKKCISETLIEMNEHSICSIFKPCQNRENNICVETHLKCQEYKPLN